MKGWKGHSYIALLARFYIGGVFLFACFHKILHPDIFALDVATYDILPLSMVNFTAITLPWVELTVSILIILGYQTRPCAFLMAAMMTLFIAALSIALYNGLDMACGCFASKETEEAISHKTLIRDIFWMALCLYILYFDNKPIGINRLLGRKAKQR